MGINLAGARKATAAKAEEMMGYNSDQVDAKKDSQDGATKTSKSSKFN